MTWTQGYDPLGNAALSTACAALPIVVLLGGIGLLGLRAHVAAVLGLLSALGVAIVGFGMPVATAAAAAAFGAAYGVLPIGWIVLNVIFLYQLTSERGLFDTMRQSIVGITVDRRLQLLLIAFCFGAFFEGAAGFGTPVAVCGAMLVGLGFRPLAASGLSLIANTAPVAFGALGTPLIALAGVTGLPLDQLSAMVGLQLAPFSILVPFWLVTTFAGFRGMIEVWPAILVAGAAFAVPQYLISNYHGPWLVCVAAALCSIGALVGFLRVWQPKRLWLSVDGEADAPLEPGYAGPAPPDVRRAWLPWLILSVCVFLWGIPQVKLWLDSLWSLKAEIPGLHEVVRRGAPFDAALAPEPAILNLGVLSMTGTGILVAALVSAAILRIGIGDLARAYARTLVLVSASLLTIAAMLSLGFVSRFSGIDTTLGFAFASTGVFYPFFGTMLGWLGVALTGSDTASNVLFGNLQKITSERLGIDPVLMAAANSSGGVMGKMIDAQSIVVASTATRWFGHEGEILRYVFFHSIALACLISLLVTAQAKMG